MAVPDSALASSASDSPDSSAAGGDARTVRRPWATMVMVTICVGFFAAISAETDPQSWNRLLRLGFQDAPSIWDGAYWALITSAFVHTELWHVAFNVYWLWVLGSRLERAIGTPRFVAFVLIAAFVSSAFQLAVSDTTGIGASGVGYAIFGLMWQSRDVYPQFREVITLKIIQLFIVWAGGCVIATQLNIVQVGNAAHISGLIFGVAVAYAFVAKWWQKSATAVAVGMILFSAVPLFWCPWSPAWVGHKAYQAHVAEQYEDAISLYSRVLELDPKNAWAYLNRSYAFTTLGRNAEAEADLTKARELDPEVDALP